MTGRLEIRRTRLAVVGKDEKARLEKKIFQTWLVFPNTRKTLQFHVKRFNSTARPPCGKARRVGWRPPKITLNTCLDTLIIVLIFDSENANSTFSSL